MAYNRGPTLPPPAPTRPPERSTVIPKDNEERMGSDFIMPFGQYRGHPLSEVSTDYLGQFLIPTTGRNLERFEREMAKRNGYGQRYGHR